MINNLWNFCTLFTYYISINSLENESESHSAIKIKIKWLKSILLKFSSRKIEKSNCESIVQAFENDKPPY